MDLGPQIATLKRPLCLLRFFYLSGAGEISSMLQFCVKFKEKIKVPEAESFEVLLLRQSECNSYNFQ